VKAAMTNIRSGIFIFVFCLIISSGVSAQHHTPDSFTALKIAQNITINGDLSEQAWSDVMRISNFIQLELNLSGDLLCKNCYLPLKKFLTTARCL